MLSHGANRLSFGSISRFRLGSIILLQQPLHNHRFASSRSSSSSSNSCNILPFDAIPSPPAHFLKGHLDSLLNIWDAFNGLHEKHGPMVRMHVGPAFKPLSKMVIVSNPGLFKQVLRSKDFTNSMNFNRTFGFFFPTSVIVSQGEQWKRIRKVVASALRTHVVDSVVPEASKLFADATNKLDTTEPVEMHEFYARATLDGFGIFGFGYDFGTLRGQNLEFLKALQTLSLSMPLRMRQPPFVWKLPLQGNQEVDAAVRLVRDKALEILKATKQDLNQLSKPTNLAEALILAADEQHSLSNEELVDQICTFFFGAFDTTSNSLSFITHLLANNPAVQQKLAEEVSSVMGSSTVLTSDHLADMPYLDAVIHEANRFFPTAVAIGRTALSPVEVGGHTIPEGATVLLNHHYTGMHHETWGETEEESSEFRPERWMEKKPAAFTVMPFGQGPRVCPGKKIAFFEMKVVVAHLVKEVRILPSPEHPMEIMVGLALQPKNGAYFKFERR